MMRAASFLKPYERYIEQLNTYHWIL
jgi:hypothetical protein